MTVQRNEILYMIRVAYLNAIILAFLSLQFVLPIAYIVLLPVIPAIVALQVLLISAPVAAASAGILIGLSFFVLGIDVGLWAAVYVTTGCALGVSWRLGAPWFVRALMTTVAAAMSLLGVIAALSWITQISLTEAENVVRQLSIYEGLPLPLLFGISMLVIGLLIWGTSDHVVSRVMKQLGELQNGATSHAGKKKA